MSFTSFLSSLLAPTSPPKLLNNGEQLFNLYYIFVGLSYFRDFLGWEHKATEWPELGKGQA